MHFDEAEISADLLTKIERLRQWRASVGVERCAYSLLKAFRKSASPKHRETIWNALLEVLSMKEEDLSEAALKDWINELSKALRHMHPEIRSQALSALHDFAKYIGDDADVISNLVRSLYDELQDVRGQAVYAVCGFASRQLLFLLVDSLVDSNLYKPTSDDPDKRSLWHALFALDEVVDRLDLSANERDEIAGKIFQALLGILQRPEPSSLDIWKVGDSLGEHIKGQSALSILRNMFVHPNPLVRDSAVHGLGHLRGDEAIKLINLALCDREPEVRQEAQRALAEISAKQ